MIRSVTLLGSSSGRNAGDAALLAGLMDSVDQAVGRPLLYEIPTIKPGFVTDTYRNRVRPVGMMPWQASIKMLGLPTSRSIHRTDLSLLFDAILFDRSLYNPLFNFLSSLYFMLPRAHRKGKRMACFDVGVGPVDSRAGRNMLREVAERMAFITVRDEESLHLLQEVGVENPRILPGADAAVLVEASPAGRVDSVLEEAGLDPAGELLGINVNRYLDSWARPKRAPMGKARFLDLMSCALGEVAAQTGAAVLLVATQHHDVAISQALAGRLPAGVRRAVVSNRTLTPFDIKAVLGRCSLLFAMRLHASILGSSALAPSLGLAYQPKVSYYYNSLGLSECCLDFEAFTMEGIVDHVMRGWRERDRLRQSLSERIPVLQFQARKAARLVAALHNDEDLDEAYARIAEESCPP
jgi:polysaccharide pyruvyl transferase WcaK-like protein